jgi:hypothetical protein
MNEPKFLDGMLCNTVAVAVAATLTHHFCCVNVGVELH